MIVAGIGLFELEGFRALWPIRRSEFWLDTATAVPVLGLGMLGGIAFAIGLSLLAALVRLGRPHTAELGRVEGTDTVRDIERSANTKRVSGLLIYRIDDELFFANAAFFVRDVKARLVHLDPAAGALVIDAEGVSDINTTTIEQLGESLDNLAVAEIEVALARVRKPVIDMLDRSGLLERIGTDRIFLEVDDAVAALRPRG